jgi:hypothetical protein
VLTIRQRINAARIRDQQEVNVQLGIADNPDSDEEETIGEQLDLHGLISFAINKTYRANIRPKALKVLFLASYQVKGLPPNAFSPHLDPQTNKPTG